MERWTPPLLKHGPIHVLTSNYPFKKHKIEKIEDFLILNEMCYTFWSKSVYGINTGLHPSHDLVPNYPESFAERRVKNREFEERMVRTPICDKSGLRKGTWTVEEDRKLMAYVTRYGCWNWRQLPKFAGNFPILWIHLANEF